MPLITSIAGGLISAGLRWIAEHSGRRRRQQLQRQAPLRFSVEFEIHPPWAVRSAAPLDPTGLPIDLMNSPPVHEWATRAGGVDAHRTKVRITVHTSGPDPVSIEDLRAEVIRRLPPVSGYHYWYESAGMAGIAKMDIDLDDETHEALEPYDPEVGHLYVRKRWFDDRRIELADAERFQFILTAYTSESLIEWQLIVRLRVGNELVTRTIDNNGEPFRTTAAPDDGSKRIWIRWTGKRKRRHPAAAYLVPDNEIGLID